MLFLFEDFALDTDRRELRRGATLVAVEPQVFDLLSYLIVNRERVATKDDLIASVWGGRVVSESTLTTRINAARCAIGDSGAEQRLIKTLLRKGVRFVGTVRGEQKPKTVDTATVAPARPRPALSLTDRPSISVLPFNNLNGDPEQDYFADGMVEEITTALSRVSWLFVVARNSSFTYKGRAIDLTRVARELGVRYVLEGSVRKAGQRVRIAAQLIDATNGAHLWADRFEGSLGDIFDLQDQVTTSVVGAIALRLEDFEIARAKRKPPENLNAYDCFLRGMASVHQGTAQTNNQSAKETFDEALRLLYKAIELDPSLASAYGWAAWCYLWRKTCAWMTDSERETAEVARLARRAVELGKDDAVALCKAGHALAHVVGNYDGAIALIDRALALNPNLVVTWFSSSWVRVWSGEPEVAIDHMMRAMHLSPLDPLLWSMQTAVGFAHLFAGRYDEARSWAAKSLLEPNFLPPPLRVAAASSALAGHLEDAKQAMAQLRQIDPARRVSNVFVVCPARRPEDLARLQEGLRIAGLSE